MKEIIGKKGVKKTEGAVFYVQRVLFLFFLFYLGKGVLFPFHLFDDGGGVDVKVQPRAELKKPFRNDVQFV